MKSFTYTRINNLTGFIVFCIAATVYCLTVEPTASFWDCGEFIVSAYKLEVGHPPGAPFFMLTAVEGEVYAYSSLFTALFFWLILKWEDEADTVFADRWLILIA